MVFQRFTGHHWRRGKTDESLLLLLLLLQLIVGRRCVPVDEYP